MDFLEQADEEQQKSDIRQAIMMALDAFKLKINKGVVNEEKKALSLKI